MIFKESKLKGAFEIELEPHKDERGFFARVYDEKIFLSQELPVNWVQENISMSFKKNTLRGLHFQYPPNNEAKLVSVLRGEAFFVFVDLRKNSETLGKWDSFNLGEENKKMIFVPRGFALGMFSLTENCLLHYKMDNFYASESAETIKWNDLDLNIKWPVQDLSVISEKDKNGKSFKEFLYKTHGIEL